MLTVLLTALPLLAAPDLPVPSGAEIVFDGKVEAAEWAGAFALDRDVGDGKTLRVRLRRQGPWLAIGLACDRAYRGEGFRLHVSDEAGAWVATLFFGIGEPTLPPLLWRRASPVQLASGRILGEAPRGCRARLDIEDPAGWSAEYLVRMGTLGIGRDDRRALRGHLAVGVPGADEPEILLAFPEDTATNLDPARYAPLASGDGWGAAERWAPVSPEISREFDDHVLLHRLYLEYQSVLRNEPAPAPVIAAATAPRRLEKIRALRAELEAARARNPTLPQWRYFLGRLLNESNLYDEARALVEALPPALLALDPFARLAAEHYFDTGEFEKAMEIARAHPRFPGMQDLMKMAYTARRWVDVEAEAVRKDERKRDPNPVVRLVTAKGDIVCELFEDDAPNAVTNLMDLVQKRHYDGVPFGTVIGRLAAKVGEPSAADGAPAAGPGWRLKPDQSPRLPLRGYLATVPLEEGGHHGSEFVIALSPLVRDAPRLVTFGRVVEGQDVAESLEAGDQLLRVEIVRKRNHGYDAVASRLR